jgi:hypothetical protein
VVSIYLVVSDISRGFAAQRLPREIGTFAWRDRSLSGGDCRVLNQRTELTSAHENGLPNREYWPISKSGGGIGRGGCEAKYPSYIEITQLYRNSAAISKLWDISKSRACIEIRPYFDISPVFRNNWVISKARTFIEISFYLEITLVKTSDCRGDPTRRENSGNIRLGFDWTIRHWNNGRLIWV